MADVPDNKGFVVGQTFKAIIFFERDLTTIVEDRGGNNCKDMLIET